MTPASRRRVSGKSDQGASPSPSSTKHEVAANPFHAFRDVCYDFGIEELADALGTKRGTLYNKADADADSHHQPTLRDVVNVTRVSGDHRILESLDRMFDRAGFLLLPPSTCSDEALLELLCKVGSESGQLHEAVGRALADGKFTASEMLRVRGEAFDLVGQVMAFLQRLEGLVDE